MTTDTHTNFIAAPRGLETIDGMGKTPEAAQRETWLSTTRTADVI